MNKTMIAKFVVSSISGAGVYHVVDGIVANNVNFGNLNRFGVFTVAAGRIALAAATAHKTRLYTDAVIDELIETWQQAEVN